LSITQAIGKTPEAAYKNLMELCPTPKKLYVSVTDNNETVWALEINKFGNLA
jgi:hypothetical protein